MARFVNIPTTVFAQAMRDANFVKVSARGEDVYAYAHDRDPAYCVKIYSSIRSGAPVAREAGTDAIRVCLVWTSPDGKAYGIRKATKVLRTGSVEGVIGRTLERARELYRLASRMTGSGYCSCGAPKLFGSGRCARQEDCPNEKKTEGKIEARTVTTKDEWGHERVVGGFGNVGRDREPGEDDEPAIEPKGCPLCGGELTVLGALGKLTHYRCRACGADCNKEN